jgi:hypothetical protein
MRNHDGAPTSGSMLLLELMLKAGLAHAAAMLVFARPLHGRQRL